MPDNKDEAAILAMKALGAPLPLPKPPGVQPLPWKEQAAQFIELAPDLILGGPGRDRIAQQYGPDAPEQYVTSMLQQIAKRRQRRRPM